MKSFSGTIQCPIDSTDKTINAQQISKEKIDNGYHFSNQVLFHCENTVVLPGDKLWCAMNSTQECVMMTLSGNILGLIDTTQEQGHLTKIK